MTHLRPDSSVSASPQQSVAHLERSDTHSAQPSTQTAWNMTVFSPCRRVHTNKKWSQAFEGLQTGTRLLKESVTCWWEFPYTETSWWCRWGLCWWGGGGPARGEPRLCHVLPQSWHTQSRVTCHDTLIPETSPAPAKKKYRNYKTGGVGLKTAGTFSIFISLSNPFHELFHFVSCRILWSYSLMSAGLISPTTGAVHISELIMWTCHWAQFSSRK